MVVVVVVAGGSVVVVVDVVVDVEVDVEVDVDGTAVVDVVVVDGTVVEVVVDGTAVVVVVVGGGVPCSAAKAAATSIRPRPKALSAPATPRSVAVASRACSAVEALASPVLIKSAMAPATWGAATEVPVATEYMPKRSVV